jgi:DNA-binding MarR family transcriptional regulator
MGAGAETKDAIARELDAIRAGLRDDASSAERNMVPLFGRIGAVAGLYRIFYERFLAAARLTHTEYQVLGIVRGIGPRSPSQLARSIRQTTAGMTKTLDRLERAGLIERRSHPSDRRSVEIVLTEPGAELAGRLMREELSAQRGMLGDMGREERERLIGSLDELIERIVDGLPGD